MANREPKLLSRGRDFHQSVQADWLRKAAGKVKVEKPITKSSGRRGRIDVFVAGAGDGLVAVAEIKASRWNRMTASAVRRNVLRHTREVWEYIESQLADGNDVSPRIIYSRRPTSTLRLQLIESLFEERGIAVACQDETVADRRARAGLPLAQP